ncbi:hypothetical protein J5X84_39975 [Streptosporangiaceae bacterium NEAU-GS5]|nr:hypothetical protein [Streptosporangiaceae bacterium NEAU-GS5]
MLSPRAQHFLTTTARWTTPTSVHEIRRSPRAVDASGAQVDVPAGAVSAMTDFELAYGGLTYSLWNHDIAFGLDNDPTVYQTPEGWSFVGGLDGAWANSIDVLLDGRSGLTLPDAPLRILNRSIDQRLESDALLATVSRWPHATWHIPAPRATPPTLDETVPSALIVERASSVSDTLPPFAPEASGPGDLWWYDETSAVHLTLHDWWTHPHDIWTVRALSKNLHTRNYLIARLPYALPTHAFTATIWCLLCDHHTPPGTPCPA